MSTDAGATGGNGAPEVRMVAAVKREWEPSGRRRTRRSSGLGWKEVQQRTFTNWVNHKLKPRALVVEDLFVDLRDGTKLINLFELLSGKTIGRYIKMPRMRIQQLENVQVALAFLTGTEGVKLVNIGAEDIVDSNQSIVLGLIWTLLEKYAISLLFKNGGGKKAILGWLRAAIGARTRYKTPIRNFTSDWEDGTAICKLTNAFIQNPDDSIDLLNLPETALERAELGVRMAEELLGVPRLLSPEDMTSGQCDEMSMMMYLIGFREAQPEAFEDELPGKLCTFDECCEAALEEFDFCVAHKCPAPACASASTSEEVLPCPEHRCHHEPGTGPAEADTNGGGADDDGQYHECAALAAEGARYCAAHQCGCSYHTCTAGLAGGSRFCRDHVCSRNASAGCVGERLGRSLAEGGPKATLGALAEVCAEHRCGFDGCLAGRDEDGAACDDHCCNHVFENQYLCRSLVDVGGEACPEHQCLHADCHRRVAAGKTLCPEHHQTMLNSQCKFPSGCQAPVTAGGAFCPAHTCRHDGCVDPIYGADALTCHAHLPKLCAFADGCERELGGREAECGMSCCLVHTCSRDGCVDSIYEAGATTCRAHFMPLCNFFGGCASELPAAAVERSHSLCPAHTCSWVEDESSATTAGPRKRTTASSVSSMGSVDMVAITIEDHSDEEEQGEEEEDESRKQDDGGVFGGEQGEDGLAQSGRGKECLDPVVAEGEPYCKRHFELASTCRVGGCARPIAGAYADGARFCVEHACSAPGCLAARMQGGVTWCPQHQPAADSGARCAHPIGCPLLAVDGETFCSGHICTIDGCHHGIESDADYCKDHKCALAGCHEVREPLLQHCYAHGCETPKCTNTCAGLDMTCCEDHRCLYLDGCSNAVTADGLDLCAMHTCRRRECFEMISSEGSNFCEHHGLGLYVGVSGGPQCKVSLVTGAENRRRLLYEPKQFGESFQVQIMWRGRSITPGPIVINTKSASHPQTMA